jgi:hypothetical protein
MSKSNQELLEELKRTVLKTSEDVSFIKNKLIINDELLHNLVSTIEKVGIILDRKDQQNLISSDEPVVPERQSKSRKKPKATENVNTESAETNKDRIEDKIEDKQNIDDKIEDNLSETDNQSEASEESTQSKNNKTKTAKPAKTTTTSRSTKAKATKGQKKERSINKSEYFKLMYDKNENFFDMYIGKAKSQILEDNKEALKGLTDSQLKKEKRILFYNYMRDNYDNELKNMKVGYINDEQNKNVKLLENQN